MTKEQVEKVLAQLEQGVRLRTALAANGVSHEEHLREATLNPAYRMALARSEATAQAALEMAAYQAGLSDAKIAQGELARRDPFQHSEKFAVELARAMLQDSEERERLLAGVDIRQARQRIASKRAALAEAEPIDVAAAKTKENPQG